MLKPSSLVKGVDTNPDIWWDETVKAWQFWHPTVAHTDASAAPDNDCTHECGSLSESPATQESEPPFQPSDECPGDTESSSE